MRILLIGEYSRLHNSLKEGLLALGHDVVLIANGDGFKNYPADLSTKAKWCESKLMQLPRKAIHKLTRFDIATLEFGIRFFVHLKKLNHFDVVQLINEAPIQTTPKLERYLLKPIFKHNKKVFLLCCGIDYTVAQHLIQKKERYSIMNPYFENPKSIAEYGFILDYLSKSHQKTHQLVYQNCKGCIASDIDYLLPLQNHPKFLGLIPNPVVLPKKLTQKKEHSNTVKIFLGINSGTYYTKGISFFEEALRLVEQKYQDRITITIVKNIPYKNYIEKFNDAHIVLDQVYSFDQGYNALEAMSKGKVVFTGAETEFTTHYKLEQKVAINALPDVAYLVTQLSFLIENPEEIETIGQNAADFVAKEHDSKKIAQTYLDTWNKH